MGDRLGCVAFGVGLAVAGAALGGVLWWLTDARSWMLLSPAFPVLAGVLLIGSLSGWHKVLAVRRSRKRMSEIADLIGARQGTLFREERSGGGGLQGPPSLFIGTIRHGPADDVLRAQIDAAVSAGYPRPAESPRGYGNSRGFDPGRGLPALHIEMVIPGSERARLFDLALTEGTVAALISLHQAVS